MKNDFEFTHRNMNVQCRFIDGFAPTWDVYVRWPGYKNRKYFTSLPAWKNLPSKCESIVKERIDVQLDLAFIDIVTASYGTRRYKVSSVTNEGNYMLKGSYMPMDSDYFCNVLRFNPKEGRVEVQKIIDGSWDVFISDAEITQVNMWNRS